jgi:hypothetical protein
VLFEQWRLACEIGAENVRRGVVPTSISVLVGMARRYREASSVDTTGSATASKNAEVKA